MERLVPGEHEPLHRRMFACDFTYGDVNFLQCKGYSFESLPNPYVFREKYYDVDFWKAQLAFRGASSAGGNLVQLVERCINAGLPDSMHPRVAVAGNKLSREWVRLTWGEDELENDEDDDEDEEEGDEDDEDEEEEEEEEEDYDGDDEDDENDGWNEEDYDGDGESSEYENINDDDYDEFEDMDEDGADNVIQAVFNGIPNGGGYWQVTYYSYQT